MMGATRVSKRSLRKFKRSRETHHYLVALAKEHEPDVYDRYRTGAYETNLKFYAELGKRGVQRARRED